MGRGFGRRGADQRKQQVKGDQVEHVASGFLLTPLP